MGKTHYLTQWFKFKKSNKVMFISAERFMYQFVKSIKSVIWLNSKNTLEYRCFTNRRYSVYEWKRSNARRIFHTFNALLDKGSQIIVSADRAPNKLSRFERIKSRFSGGLVVDIQKYRIWEKIVQKNQVKNYAPDEIKISDDIRVIQILLI